MPVQVLRGALIPAADRRRAGARVREDTHQTRDRSQANYESSVPVEVTTPGSLAVCCDKLHAILRSLADGEIEFEQRNPMALYHDPVA